LGVPITNTTSHPSPAAGIGVTGGTGAFSTDVGANVGISAVNNSAGMIVIGLGTPTASFTVTPTTRITFPTASMSSFYLDGVLVSFNGTGKVSLNATLSITGNGYALDTIDPSFSSATG